MRTVLVTGFGLWQGVTYNPTALVAKDLDGTVASAAAYGAPGSAKIVGRVLDVAWDDGVDAVTVGRGKQVSGAAAALARAVNDVRPDLLVSFGVTPGGADTFDVEPVADDSNYKPSELTIMRGGPLGTDVRGLSANRVREHPTSPHQLDLTFPHVAIVKALRDLGLNAISSPGLSNFLCERIAYEGAWLAKYGPRPMLMSGFIHVPNPMIRATGSSSTDASSLDTEGRGLLASGYADVLRAAKAAVEVCLAYLQDDRLIPPKWLRKDRGERRSRLP